MTDTPLDAYLAELTARGLDARAVAIVRALDRAIRGAGPELESTIKYKILMYGLHGDWRTWVCAVDATTKGVGLRFLYGVILDDPLSVLRAGSSVLKTWDVGFDDAIDAAAVGAYVAEAVAKYSTYKAEAPTILEASRAAASKPRRGTAP